MTVACGGSARDAALDGQIIRATKLEGFSAKPVKKWRIAPTGTDAGWKNSSPRPISLPGRTTLDQIATVLRR
jgi:hypothetical protein